MQRLRGAIFLAFGVIALALVSGVSFLSVVDLPFWLTRSDWLTFHAYHGRFRVFWVRSYGDPIDVVSYRDPVHIRLSNRPSDLGAASSRGPIPMPPRQASDVQIRIGTSWQVDNFGMNYGRVFPMPGNPNARARISFFRVPIWLIAGLLLFIPIRAALFGPIRFRRRIRRNRCGFCGYDLTGLTEPRCPECGMAI